MAIATDPEAQAAPRELGRFIVADPAIRRGRVLPTNRATATTTVKTRVTTFWTFSPSVSPGASFVAWNVVCGTAKARKATTASCTERRSASHAAASSTSPDAKRPAPASVARWALNGGSAATSRGSQPGKSSNQPSGERTAHSPAMAFGIIAIESGFDPHAIGREGERGLMQIKPSTARAYDRRITAQALHDPALNVRLGLRHLTREVEFFGDRSLGLMSYRMGRARLEREMADGVPPRDGYAERVLSICGPDCA